MRSGLAVCVFLVAAVFDARAASPAPQPARIARAAELRDAPAGDARLLSSLPADTAVSVLARSGGWYRVEAPAGEGWVRLSAVRFATAGGASRGGLSAPLRILQSGRAAVTTGTVTTGVRGLSEADLQASTPDPAAVALLDRWSADAAAAQSFAKEAGLQAASVPELASPEEPRKRRR